LDGINNNPRSVGVENAHIDLMPKSEEVITLREHDVHYAHLVVAAQALLGQRKVQRQHTCSHNYR
jgi:hypothetical protein